MGVIASLWHVMHRGGVVRGMIWFRVTENVSRPRQFPALALPHDQEGLWLARSSISGSDWR